MAKDDVRPSKRRKVDEANHTKTPDIRGAFELHDLLRFRQSTGPEVKTGAYRYY